MNTFQKMLVAYKNGINNPYMALRAAQAAGLPFSVMCAVLEKESNGGDNVFGHDPTIFVGAGKVTKSKYLEYKKQRQAGKGMQGVGPMQLTWWEFQDRADARGGCWKPYINMQVGAEILVAYWNQYGNWEKVGTKWNGSSVYGKDFAAQVDKWKKLFSA